MFNGKFCHDVESDIQVGETAQSEDHCSLIALFYNKRRGKAFPYRFQWTIVTELDQKYTHFYHNY